MTGRCGRLVEIGRSIGITCRNSVRKVISPGNLIAGLNLVRCLKVVAFRSGNWSMGKTTLSVQVVLLFRRR